MTGRRLSAAGASLAIAALLGGGCSAIVGPRPPERPLRAADGCSNNRVPFHVDALAAGAAAGTAGLMFAALGLEYLSGAGETTPSWDPQSTAPSNTGTLATIGAAATAATVVLFLSARYGLACVGLYLLSGAVTTLVALSLSRSEIRQV